ncbi:hypothetical protein V8B97DRAFT_1969470 [Scleroderma yunnanense]
MAEQENIETVHEPKLIQTAVTLCGQGRRAMEGPQGPQTHVHEGAYAIKVSMKNSKCPRRVFISFCLRTVHLMHPTCT